MAGLQRSSETFRRSGSSGTVWEDKHRSASGELTAKRARPKDRQQRSGHAGYRTAGHVQPALEPPSTSPRAVIVDACCFCSLFGKDKHRPPRRGKGRRR